MTMAQRTCGSRSLSKPFFAMLTVDAKCLLASCSPNTGSWLRAYQWSSAIVSILTNDPSRAGGCRAAETFENFWDMIGRPPGAYDSLRSPRLDNAVRPASQAYRRFRRAWSLRSTPGYV